MLPENRLEHRWHFAAANHVRQDAASTPVLDDPVDISHANMALKEVKYVAWMWLNSWAETIILVDPAKHHYNCIDLHLCTNFLRRPRTVVNDPCKAMHFESTLTTDISSEFMQSKVGWGVPLTLYLVCPDRAPKGSPVNGHFNKLKKLSYTPVGRHAIYYIMAWNSNAAAAIGSWLSSKNSHHQTIRGQMEKKLLRMISHKRRLVAKIA